MSGRHASLCWFCPTVCAKSSVCVILCTQSFSSLRLTKWHWQCMHSPRHFSACRDLAHTIQSNHYGLHKQTANIGAWDIFHMQDKDSNLVGHCMCWHTLTKLLMILTQRARTWFQSSRVKVVKQARQATTYNCSLIRLLN